MRVAMVANWWYRRGGLGGVMMDEASWLTQRGHEILPFASAHPSNVAATTSAFFPPFVETTDLGRGLGQIARLRAAQTIIRNPEAARRFREFIRSARPDLVHLHGTARQLSPSILGEARAAGIPIVMTLHDFGLVCPQGLLYKAGKTPCTAPNCVRGNPIYAVKYRCIKGSAVGSALGAIEQLVHRSLGWYRDRVGVLIAPSHFLMDLVGRSGAVDPHRLRYLPNGLASGPPAEELPGTGGHVLFSGRLVAEKGLAVLMEAARRLPSVPMIIAGDGPLRDALAGAAPDNVVFVGQQDESQLNRLRDGAITVVSPSVWYENAPLAVLEAMRAARPVVLTGIGGQAELIAEGGGLVVQPEDVDGLAEAIGALWNDRPLARQHGSAGRRNFLDAYGAERHIDGLETIYQEALTTSNFDGPGQTPPKQTSVR